MPRLLTRCLAAVAIACTCEPVSTDAVPTTDAAPTPADCSRAILIASLVETPCDNLGSTCDAPSFDSGLSRVICEPNVAPSDAAPTDPPGCCWIGCDYALWPGSGCPPAMVCGTGEDFCQKRNRCQPDQACL